MQGIPYPEGKAGLPLPAAASLALTGVLIKFLQVGLARTQSPYLCVVLSVAAKS